MDNKRIVLFSAIALLFVSPAAAVDWSTATNWAGNAADTGVSFLENYANLELGDQDALQVFSAIGVLYLAVFVAIERTLEYAGMKDMFVKGGGRHGEDKSNWRLILFSLVFFGVFVGSGWFAPIIITLANSIVLSIGVGVAAIIIYSAVAGKGVLMGGWSGAKGTGRAAKAAGKQKYSENTEELADAKKRTQEANEYMQQTQSELQDAEQRAESGDASTADDEAKDGADKLEQALQDMETALAEVGDIYEKDQAELQNLLDQIQTVKYQSQDVRGPARDFENRLESMKEALEIIVGTGGSGDASLVESQITSLSSNNWSSYADMMDSINQIQGDLEAIAGRVDNAEAGMSSEMKEIAQLVKQFEETEKILENLSSEIKEAKEADNFEEKLAEKFGDDELYEEAEYEKSQIQELGNQLEALEEKHDKIEGEISEAVNLVEKQLDLDESEMEELERVRSNLIPDIASLHEQAEQAIASNSAINRGSGGKDDELINVVESIKPAELERRIEEIEGRMSNREGSIGNILDSIGGRFT